MTHEHNAYAPQPTVYQSVPRKPPLTRELRRTAVWAGLWGFMVMWVGWSLLSLAVGIGLFAGLVAVIFGFVTSSSSRSDVGVEKFGEFMEMFSPGWVVAVLVGVGLIGLGLWVLSLFISRGMLRRAGHPSPWGVTWAGAGIAVTASWVLSWIATIPLQFVTALVSASPSDLNGGVLAALAFIGLLLNVAMMAAIGGLSWWWMAHAMRPAAVAAQ